MVQLHRLLALLLFGLSVVSMQPTLAASDEIRAEIPLIVLADAKTARRTGELVPHKTTQALLGYLSQQSGLKFKLTPYPWNRAITIAMNGESAIFGLSKTSVREATLDFSDLVYSEEVLLVTRHDNAFVFRSLEDLRGKRVGIQLGASYNDEFERGKNSIFVADESANGAVPRLHQLLAGRIDVAVYANGRSKLERLLQKAPELERKLQILDPPLTHNDRYFAFPKAAKAQANLLRLNAAINQGIRSGAITELMTATE